MRETFEGFQPHQLDERHRLYSGRLPERLQCPAKRFEELWGLHPDDYHEIRMLGRLVKTPRWQQAYGADYHYTGQTNQALPIPPCLEPLLDWARSAIHQGLNGLLLNWYDGGRKHSIGPHHDSIIKMVAGAPIVTISLGEERIFRLSRPRPRTVRDFPAPDGTVFLMPFDTNRAWKHAVPHFARWRGRRISITLRAFETANAS